MSIESLLVLAPVFLVAVFFGYGLIRNARSSREESGPSGHG